MSKIATIIWSTIGISIMIAMLVMAVIYGYQNRPTEEVCSAIEYIIEDRDERLYVTERELDALLRTADIYPVGRKINRISLQRIEDAIAHHPMVRNAECYMTARNGVEIRIRQRIPIVRIQTPIDTYLIDTDRKVMEARESVRDDILRVRGTIGVQMACGQMVDFAMWLEDEEYWQERIAYLYVKTPQMIYIYLRGEGQPRIVLGKIDGYERKLAKLKVFMENINEEIREKQYTELDLRYHGQVVGRY